MYKALIEESLKKPYSSLFNDYNNTQKKLIATGSMMSTMLHDIKNPLTNIRALGQLGNKTTDSIKDKGYYTKIIEHVDKVTKMINKINKAFDFDNLKEINPMVPLEEILTDLKTLCHSKNIELKENLNEINANVVLEEDLFQRVIYNIVKNAVQVLDENGVIEIDIKEQKDNIMISISDNGPGIPSKIQKDIFKPYITTGGTGLGLYMVNFAVKDIFGGEVWFESEQGKGTTFFIKLPKANSEKANSRLQGNLYF